MPAHLAPLLLITALAASCSTPEPQWPAPMSSRDDLESAYCQPPARFSTATVTCSIHAGESEVLLAPVTFRRGKSGKTSHMRELSHPTEFAFPQISARKASDPPTPFPFPITPASPTRFATSDVGWTLDLTARPRGRFVMLTGTLTSRSAGGQIRAAGVPFQPIFTEATDFLGRKVPVILTENAAEQPAIVTEEFPIYIAVTGHGAYHVDLGDGREAEFLVETAR